MKMLHVEHPLLLVGNPLFLRERLTLRTMTIAARVVRRTLVSAIQAFVEVPAEGRGATLPNIGEHSLLLWAERMLPFERCAMTSNDVRNVETPGPLEAGHALSPSISR